MEKEFKLIGTFQYSAEAQIIKGKLEFEGIEVYIRDNNTIDSNPLYSQAIGGVKLYVVEENVEKANQILSTISEFSLDDNNKLIKCPKCGAEQIEMYTSIKDIKSLLSFIFSSLFALLPFHAKHKYKCQNCKNEF
jgi:DNA-directed RNA polymerase subunit RPC12/RpoP